jgi:hypothetical protein
MSLKKDLEFGLKKELDILPIIKLYFKRDIQKTIDKFCNYDFYDSKYNYELKSRRCSVNKYDTTLLPSDKIKNRMIYLFSFLDGLYYIKYNKEKFDTFETKKFVRNKRSDTVDVYKSYVYIPSNKLKKIIVNDEVVKDSDLVGKFTINF